MQLILIENILIANMEPKQLVTVFSSKESIEEEYVPIAFKEEYTPIAFKEGDVPIAFKEEYTPIAFKEGDTPIAVEEEDVPIAFKEGDAPIAFKEGDVPIAFKEEGYTPIAFKEGDAPIAFEEEDVKLFKKESKKSIQFEQLLLNKNIMETNYTIIFKNGDIFNISSEYNSCLKQAIVKGNASIFFNKWNLTTFVNLEKQKILDPNTQTCISSICLYYLSKISCHNICLKYDIPYNDKIVLVIDRYDITKKNFKKILEIEYFDDLTFFEIIDEYKKFSLPIKELFIEFFGFECPMCKNKTNVDFTIFPNVYFAKCAKCRHLKHHI